MTFKASFLFFIILVAAIATAQNTNNSDTIDVLQDFSSRYEVVSAKSYDFHQVLANSDIPAHQVSFYVQDVARDKPLISENANRIQNPGSTIKLLTSYAALKTFGVNYRWRTELLSEAKPDANGILSQALYLKGSGDPHLVVEKVEQLVQGLTQMRIKEIRAPIVVDRSIFQDEAQNAASFDGEPSRPYNAQPDGALINFRAISFTFNPSTQSVSVTPALSNYAVNVDLHWSSGACPADGWKNSIRLYSDAHGVTIGGTYYEDCGSQQWHIHAHQMNANDYVQGIMASLMPKHAFIKRACYTYCANAANSVIWNSAALMAADAVKSGRVPPHAKVLSSVESNPLHLILKDMNHFSNNVMARQIYLTLSTKAQRQGSLVASANVVRRVLQQQGLSTHTVIMGNGSGLSRATAISAQELGRLLVKAIDEPSLYDSLPVVGVSGTMENRLIDTDMLGRGHIKTGTLNDVRAIAGYIDAKSGKRYAVVSIIQGPNAQSAAGEKIHDTFMLWVGEQ